MWARRKWWRRRTALVVMAVTFCGTAGCGGGGPAGTLVGVWNAAFNDPAFGPGTVQLILRADGTFQEQYAYQAGSLITVFGTFRVFENEGLLRLDIIRGEPSQSCGPLGCTDIIYPAGESYGYTLLDANTLLLNVANCDPNVTVCSFTHQRQV